MNILFVIQDDCGKDYCEPYYRAGFLARPRQPFLMRLAAAGVVFENYYSAPVCSMDRALIDTGRHAYRIGVEGIIQPDEELGRLDVRETHFRLANMLKREANYRCGYFGKEHLSDDGQYGEYGPLRAGYDKWAGIRGNIGVTWGTSHVNYQYWNLPPNTVPTAVNEVTTGVTTYSAVKTTQDAAAWINDAANDGRDWFCYVATNITHAPFATPPASEHTYDTNPEFGTTGGGAVLPESDEFLSMCEAFDKSFGELMASIIESGRFDWTRDVVIFAADNGTPDSWTGAPFNEDHAKGSVYAYGTRVPLIIAGAPAIGAGRRSRAVAHATDIYATILDFAGVDPRGARPETMPVDGVSLRYALEKPGSLGVRKWAYRELFPNAGPNAGKYLAAISDGQFDLLVTTNPDGSETKELYEDVADPYQDTDLIAAGPLSGRAEAARSRLQTKLLAFEADRVKGRSGVAIDPTRW